MTSGFIILGLAALPFLLGILTLARGSMDIGTGIAVLISWTVAGVLAALGVVWVIVAWVLS